MMQMQGKGKFITLEGGEGAGKSTQIVMLADFLAAKGIEVVVTREPGGSPDAEEIRKLLISGNKDRWDAVTELLLFSAARRNHLQKKILPALAEGKWVISDRFADSTAAYQGCGYGENSVPMQMLEEVYKMVAGEFVPDVTFILDIPVHKGMQRVMARGEDKARFEQMDMTFHEKLRKAYIEIAKANPKRCVLINALNTKENIHKELVKIIEQRLL